VVGVGGQGAGSQENGGWEVGEERAGSRSSKKAGIGRVMQSANFCYSLSVQILSKTELSMLFD